MRPWLHSGLPSTDTESPTPTPPPLAAAQQGTEHPPCRHARFHGGRAFPSPVNWLWSSTRSWMLRRFPRASGSVPFSWLACSWMFVMSCQAPHSPGMGPVPPAKH